MSLKSKKDEVYHGSPKNIKDKYLKPSQACWLSRDTKRWTCEMDKLVFASGNKEIAICFAANLNDFSMYGGDGKPGGVLVSHRTELSKLDNAGYLITLDKKDFSDYDKRKNELVSKKKVKILKKQRIVPRKELYKMGYKIIELNDNTALPMSYMSLKKILKKEGRLNELKK